MPKVRYDNITFDSELEVSYYQYLMENNIRNIYHPKHPIYINSKNKYTPDFICIYDDRIEIVETKGYNQFSFQRDNMIHNAMLEKTIDDLVDYLKENGFIDSDLVGKDIKYKKIKYLKSFGWVDFDFKNPNTLANNRKQKIIELEKELKELNLYKKNCDRYFNYLRQVNHNGKKLTKSQLEWKYNFEMENDLL